MLRGSMAEHKLEDKTKKHSVQAKNHSLIFMLSLVIVPLLIMLFLLLFIIKTWPVAVKIILFSALIIALLIVVFIVLPLLEKKFPKKSWLAEALKVLLLLLALGAFIMITVNKAPVVTIENTAFNYKPDITTMNMTEYKASLGIINSSNVQWYLSDYWLNSSGEQNPFLLAKAIRPDIKNIGFESGGGGSPNNWRHNGKLNYYYSSQNCFAGNKCLYVNVDDSDYGFTQLNSDEFKIIPGNLYDFSVYVNCIHCETGSAYIAVFWLKSNPRSGGRNIEFKRNILLLHNTTGYEKLSLYAWAPDNVDAAIFGLRVHMEQALVYPRTEFYMDAP